MTIEYSPNYSGFFDLYDADILFEISPEQQDASRAWEFHIDTAGWQAIEEEYPRNSNDVFPQWFAEKHNLSDGRYSFAWRVAWETIPGYGEVSTEHNSWIEMEEIQFVESLAL